MWTLGCMPPPVWVHRMRLGIKKWLTPSDLRSRKRLGATMDDGEGGLVKGEAVSVAFDEPHEVTTWMHTTRHSLLTYLIWRTVWGLGDGERLVVLEEVVHQPAGLVLPSAQRTLPVMCTCLPSVPSVYPEGGFFLFFFHQRRGGGRGEKTHSTHSSMRSSTTHPSPQQKHCVDACMLFRKCNGPWPLWRLQTRSPCDSEAECAIWIHHPWETR